MLRREFSWFTGTGVTPKIGAIADRTMERETVANSGQILKAINWSPQGSLEEGLSRTLGWYREYVASGVFRIEGPF
jgi:nucleoside-diphosphate-sugar epimerase